MSALGAVIGLLRGRPPVPPPATYTPNRAQRRRTARSRQVTTIKQRTRQELAAARRLGEQAGRRGLDHRTPGACPYNDKQRVDAWAEGYVAGKRLRERTRP